MAEETKSKYRVGYYYVVSPKEKVKEDDKYIHGLSFEVVFRIYDKDGSERLFDNIYDNNIIPEVLVHIGSGIMPVEVKDLYTPCAFKNTGLSFIPTMVHKCENPTGYEIVRYYKERSDKERDMPVPVEIGMDEFNKILLTDEFNHAANMEQDWIEARFRSIAVFAAEASHQKMEVSV